MTQQTPHESEVFDLRAALVRLGDDRKLFGDLVGFFLEDCLPLVDQIEHSIASADRETLIRAGHSIKGLASTFDAHATVRVAAEIEQAAQAGDLAKAAMGLEPLKRELSRLRAALAPYRPAAAQDLAAPDTEHARRGS